MDRRSFVKACVTTAGVGALAASGLGLAAGLAIPRKPGLPPVRYFGTHRVAGPAPRGLPYIPIEVKDGVFVGKTTLAGRAGILGMETDDEINVLEWYKYCGHSGAPGLKPDFTDDNKLTYLSKDEYEEKITPWFKAYLPPPTKPGEQRELGQPIKTEHFAADGFGAAFEWRSDGIPLGIGVLTGVIIRAPKSELTRVESTVPPAKPISQEEFDWVKREVFAEHEGNVYVAVSSFCTHFCCAPGYRELEKLARPRAAWDNLFCTCHNSNYNYREPVWFTFAPVVATEAGGFDPLLARGGGAGGSGGGH